LIEQHRAECLERFRAAVKDGRQGYYAKAKALVEKVRAEHGDAAAAIARREINECIRSDRKF
jgi:hypothetical protein